MANAPPFSDLDKDLRGLNLQTSGDESLSPDDQLSNDNRAELVDIASASLSELQTVRGVGPTTARAIDALRSRDINLSRSLMEDMAIFSRSDLDAFKFSTHPEKSDEVRLQNTPGRVHPSQADLFRTSAADAVTHTGGKNWSPTAVKFETPSSRTTSHDTVPKQELENKSFFPPEFFSKSPERTTKTPQKQNTFADDRQKQHAHSEIKPRQRSASRDKRYAEHSGRSTRHSERGDGSYVPQGESHSTRHSRDPERRHRGNYRPYQGPDQTWSSASYAGNQPERHYRDPYYSRSGDRNRQDKAYGSQFENPRGYGFNHPYSDVGYPGQQTAGPHQESWPRNIHVPKTLVFDGSKSWKTFSQTFQLFLYQFQIEDIQTQMYYFTNALTGQAADYFARMSRNKGFYDIRQAFDVMAERFDDKELSESALMQFSILTQKEGEDINDWADRVWELAYDAYPDLYPHQIYQVERNVVQQFTLGLRDKKALRHVAGKHCENMSAARNAYKVYTFTRLASGEETKAKSVHFVNSVGQPDSSSDDELSVNRLAKSSPNNRIPVKGNILDRILKAQEEQSRQISSLCSQMETLQTKLSEVARKISSHQNPYKSQRERSKSPLRTGHSISPASRRAITCFLCRNQGHFAKECPERGTANAVARNDSNESLNDNGLV